MNRRGFTLLELLAALAIFALLMVALTAFIFSMGELWGRGGEERLFRQHARAVTHGLQSLLRRTAEPGAWSWENRPDAAAAPEGSFAPSGPIAGGRTAASVRMERPADGSSYEQLLSWDALESLPQITWPGRPLPFVSHRLLVRRGDGLVLQWQSRLEKRRDEREPARETVLSPFVSALTYDYLDPQLRRWSSLPQPRLKVGGEAEVPDRISLHFQRGDWVVDAVVVVPKPAASGGLVY